MIENLFGGITTPALGGGYATLTGTAPALSSYPANPINYGYTTPTPTANTYTPPPPTNTGGSSGGTSNTGLDPHINPATGVWDDGYYASTHQGEEDPYAAIKADISSSWDNYLASLGGQETYLSDQRAAQEGQINTNYNQNLQTVNDQRTSSLRDIQNTARNAFQAGNSYLGALGAADSSAANMYSYAVNRQTQKQVGNLDNFVSGQLNTLKNQKDTQFFQVSQWFAQQQAALRQQLAQGQFNKEQDIRSLSKGILDQALAWSNQIQTNTMNQQNALLTWAANNSSNFAALNQNIQNVSSLFKPGQVSLTGQLERPAYVGTSRKIVSYDIYGRPIYE